MSIAAEGSRDMRTETHFRQQEGQFLSSSGAVSAVVDLGENEGRNWR